MITVQCTFIHATPDAAGVAPTIPDMIEFGFPAEFLKKAEKCVDFMRTNTVREMIVEHAFMFRLFRDVKNLPDGDFGGGEFVTVDDVTYAAFDSPEKITGCNAHLSVTGQAWVTLPMGDQGAALTCELRLPAA